MATNQQNSYVPSFKSVRMMELVLWEETYPDSAEILALLEQYKSIKRYAFIKHDKDVYEDGDLKGTLKKAHYHIMMHFEVAFNAEDKLPRWFHDVKVSNMCKIRKRPGQKQPSFEKALAYLTHDLESAKHKYQYPDSEVIANFPWKEVVLGNLKLPTMADELQNYLLKCGSGEIREYNLVESIPVGMYSKNKTQLINACDYYRQNRLSEIAAGKAPLTVMFVQGQWGSGKSSFATYYCQKNNKSYCISSASNDPLQDYKSQDVLIVDECRDSTFMYTDLLKFLDHTNRSSAKSRYSNKAFIGDTIIITSSVPLKQWYRNRQERDNDGLQQLTRRIDEVYDVTRDDIIVAKLIRDVSGYRHEVVGQFINPMKKVFENMPVSDTLSPMYAFLKNASELNEVQDIQKPEEEKSE